MIRHKTRNIELHRDGLHSRLFLVFNAVNPHAKDDVEKLKNRERLTWTLANKCCLEIILLILGGHFR